MNIDKRHAGRRIRKQRRQNRETAASFMRMGLSADAAARQVEFLGKALLAFVAEIDCKRYPTVAELNAGNPLIAEGNRVHAEILNGTVES